MSLGLRETIVSNPTPGASPNGAGKSPSAAAAGAQAGMAGAARPQVAPPRPREARQARFARSFAQVVAVLMRDPNFRTMPLADLEWLVLPAVMSGQFRVAEAPASLGPDKATDRPQTKAPQTRRPDKTRTAGCWCRWPWRCGRGCRARSTSAGRQPRPAGAAQAAPVGLGRARLAGGGGRRPARGAEAYRADRQHRSQGTAHQDARQGHRQYGGGEDFGRPGWHEAGRPRSD